MKILILDLDSLRPDHLGCYGYHRNTSPNIDKIAEKGVRFENYYTSDAPCLPSRTALMTGQFGIRNGAVGHGGVAADLRHEGVTRDFQDRLVTESLPGFLRAQGLKTVLVSPFAERHSAWHFNAGFNEIYNTGKGGMESAEEVTPTVLDWIERNKDNDNWCLYVNYWDPHTPYRAPETFGNPFEGEQLPAWLTEEVLESHKKIVGPHTVHEIDMFQSIPLPQYPRYPVEIRNMDDMKKMIDGYDCGIRYMDEHIGRIFKALEKDNEMDDLLIIITADHGENMGELGIYGEHGTADQFTCRVPMIVSGSGILKNHVDKGLHYSLDLAPTLAEMFNEPVKPSWDGQSYASALKGNDCGRDYLIVSQCAHVCQRSVRFGAWLYIRTYHDGYRLFDKEMLFNLKDDPYEQYNVASTHREICREAVYHLNDWHDEMMTKMEHDVDPLWTVMKAGGPFHANGHLPMYIKRLEMTGRSEAAEALRNRHPREFR